MTVHYNADPANFSGRVIEKVGPNEIRKTNAGIYMTVKLGATPMCFHVNPHKTLTEARQALGKVIVHPAHLTRPKDDPDYVKCYSNRGKK